MIRYFVQSKGEEDFAEQDKLLQQVMELKHSKFSDKILSTINQHLPQHYSAKERLVGPLIMNSMEIAEEAVHILFIFSIISF